MIPLSSAEPTNIGLAPPAHRRRGHQHKRRVRCAASARCARSLCRHARLNSMTFQGGTSAGKATTKQAASTGPRGPPVGGIRPARIRRTAAHPVRADAPHNPPPRARSRHGPAHPRPSASALSAAARIPRRPGLWRPVIPAATAAPAAIPPPIPHRAMRVAMGVRRDIPVRTTLTSRPGTVRTRRMGWRSLPWSLRSRGCVGILRSLRLLPRDTDSDRRCGAWDRRDPRDQADQSGGPRDGHRGGRSARRRGCCWSYSWSQSRRRCIAVLQLLIRRNERGRRRRMPAAGP